MSSIKKNLPDGADTEDPANLIYPTKFPCTVQVVCAAGDCEVEYTVDSEELVRNDPGDAYWTAWDKGTVPGNGVPVIDSLIAPVSALRIVTNGGQVEVFVDQGGQHS